MRILRTLSVFILIAFAANAQAKDLGQGLSCEHLARYDIATLNDILEKGT